MKQLKKVKSGNKLQPEEVLTRLEELRVRVESQFTIMENEISRTLKDRRQTKKA